MVNNAAPTCWEERQPGKEGELVSRGGGAAASASDEAAPSQADLMRGSSNPPDDGDDDTMQLSPITKKPTAVGERATKAGGGGLSELSKQLRVLQAKNQSQSIEIDRLERQLRILAELQGVSVSGLRSALEQACASEAHHELQQRVASLQAQLEAASLAQQGAGEAAATAKKVANLELRVGELEEMEENQRIEIQGLYGQLMEQKTQAARLEMLCEQQRNENEQLKMDISERSSADSPQTKIVAAEPKTMSVQAREAEAELQVLREQLALSKQQHQSVEERSRLRDAQYKARSMVQDETIRDLEQQLSSLYVAFGLIREEQSQENDTRMRLQTNLHEADAQVARQVSDLDQRKRCEAVAVPESPSKNPRSRAEASKVHTQSTVTLEEPILSGVLLVRSSNRLKKWKKRPAFLYSTLANHRLEIRGETRGYELQFGVSRVDNFHKQPFAFVIHIDPTNPQAPTIYAAATSERDYMLWMTALTAGKLQSRGVWCCFRTLGLLSLTLVFHTAYFAATTGDDVHDVSNSSSEITYDD